MCCKEKKYDRNWYLDFHKKLCDSARKLSEKKNRDYGAATDSPFANFTRVEHLGIATTEQGFLARLTDKFCRLTTFCRKGRLLVSDESVYDTITDIINYCCLLAAYLKYKEETKK